ncbi:DUF2066 domain-containing protein [Shewanella psychropiezotolerans]|uniref:DUF2066 domain-containing protein n=1 Tax=Shewanella psychropiezotolerans TaxID=2593655 RepID=A0ABX5WXS1_9GAMM|nr:MULTISPECIES: DUF2066 domain-containing protein [Shewanella]MPY24717.1 DUF2066 domain-containing protein [Shewanella sp. YLB-07]QDO83885.1 DUF2066 domain-containing protein [Shewanella psychropiezotolerans]
MLKTLLNSSIFCAGYLLLQTNLVSAAEVYQLDETLVPVESRSAAQRQKAISIGLREVVLKNSGTKASISHPSVQAKVKNPSSLLSQFGYKEIDGELFLQVSFDHQRIIQLLRDAQLPVWGKQRPLTLIWLVEDDAEARQIVNDESVLDSRELFQSASESNGVPLLFPIMDLDDNMNVTLNDIRGKFVEQVARASQRYQADYFVMASIDTRGESVEYSFALYPKSTGETMSTPLTSKSKVVKDLDTAVNEIISGVSEFYVGRYAIADSGSDLDSYVTFVDITELKQVVEIEKYFKQLSAVKSVQLTQLQGTSAKFKLDLFGTEEDLRRLMKLEPRVSVLGESMPVTPTDDGFDPLPSNEVQGPEYRWQG